MGFNPIPILNQQTSDRQIGDLQRAMSAPIEQFQNLLPLQGVYVTGVTVPSAANFVVTHNLGRPYVGWIVARWRGPITIGYPPYPFIIELGSTAQVIPESQLLLQNATASNGVIDVWVY